MKFLKVLLDLAKVKITFAVALTTVTGYILGKGTIDMGIILPTIGIFLLACGSSALNHYQEKDKDALMKRTQDRPLPSGKISPGAALLFALILVSAGSILLFYSSGFLAMQLGLLAMVWYNVIYTPLKRRTAFAVVPGSVIGAIPPLVGWVAAGAALSDPKALIMAFFFFIWQVPHFWLLMLKYGKQYEEAGFPSITEIYSPRQVRNITFIWIVATAVASLMLPVFDVVETLGLAIAILASCIWLVIVFTKLLRNQEAGFNPFYYFMRINYFVLAIMVILSVDAFIR